MNLAQIVANNRAKIILSKKDKLNFYNTNARINDIENTDLKDIKGIWEATINKLIGLWIKTQEDLKKLWEEWIKDLKLNFLSQRALIKFIK